MNLYFSKIESPIGTLIVACTEKGLSIIKIGDEEDFRKFVYRNIKNVNLIKSRKRNEEAIKQLEEYFRGKRKQFDMKIDFVTGTEFQRKVWNELKNISYGSIISYKELACRVMNENYSRAVGQANNKNPLPIVLPCHRVVGSNGELVGYGGGVPIKKWLIEFERG